MEPASISGTHRDRSQRTQKPGRPTTREGRGGKQKHLPLPTLRKSRSCAVEIATGPAVSHLTAASSFQRITIGSVQEFIIEGLLAHLCSRSPVTGPLHSLDHPSKVMATSLFSGITKTGGSRMRAEPCARVKDRRGGACVRVGWPRGGYVVDGSCRLNWQHELNDSEIPNLWITRRPTLESHGSRCFGMADSLTSPQPHQIRSAATSEADARHKKRPEPMRCLCFVTPSRPAEMGCVMGADGGREGDMTRIGKSELESTKSHRRADTLFAF